MTKNKWQIPFYKKTGIPGTFALKSNDITNDTVELKDNYEWEDVLELNNFHRGRSSATFSLVSRNSNIEYSIFMVDALEIFKHSVKGVIEGKFTFCKRGTNIGVKYIDN